MNPRLTIFLVIFITLMGDALASETRKEVFAGQAKKALVYGPQPAYPLEARAHNMTGSGLFQLRIRVSTGRVVDVAIVHSTGYSVLDVAAINTLYQWRFKPGALPPLSIENPKRREPWAAQDSLLYIPINFLLSKT